MDMAFNTHRRRPDSKRTMSVTALSYLEGIPIALIRSAAKAAFSEHAINRLPVDFEDFCEEVSRQVYLWKPIFSRLSDELFVVPWSNADPFVRHLRDHYYWRWFELRCIVQWLESDGKTWPIVEEFAPLTLSYALSRSDTEEAVLLGPIVCVDAPGDSQELVSALDRFQNIIRRYWRSSKTSPHQASPSLYSTSRLTQLAQARLDQVAFLDAPKIDGISESLRETSIILSQRDQVSLEEVWAICAVESARDALRNYKISASLLEDILSFRRGKRRLPVSAVTSFGKEDSSASKLIAHRQTTGALAWSRHFHESMEILTSRLAIYTYLGVAPTTSATQADQRTVWDGVCKFLAECLLSSEVTIYRYLLSDEFGPLQVFGGFCSPDVGGKRKLAYKTEIMRDAAADPQARRRSISYRAAESNIVQYVADTRSGDILKPDDDRWSWGDSVIALPIRINGSVWGIFEIAARAPHHFDYFLRPKCDEIAAALSSTLLNLTLFEALSALEQYWSDDFGNRVGRRPELCRKVASIFQADFLAIYTARDHAEVGAFNVTEFGRWASSNGDLIDGANSDDIVSSRKVLQFLDSDAKIEALDPPVGRTEDGLASSFSHRRSSFLVRLSPLRDGQWTGVVAFSTPHPIVTDARWEENTFTLAQMAGGIVSNLTSDASWGQQARQTLRHEYKRINNSLQGIMNGFETRLMKRLVDEEKRNADKMLGDLKDVSVSLEQAAEALKEGVSEGDRFLLADPRLVAVKRAKERYDAQKNAPIRLRDSFFRHFRSATNSNAPLPHWAQPQVTPGRSDFSVKMDEATLSDILGTLADNAAKYRASGSNIRMTMTPLDGGSVTMTVSNLAPPLEPGEERKIFEDGFRGKRARDNPKLVGSGRGLGFAKNAMAIWDGSLRYASSSSSVGENVWHRFILTFPSSIVIQD